MKQTLQDYGLSFDRVPIFIDNMSAISIAKNPVLHSRTKHIDIQFHYLRDNHERGHIDLIHVPSERQTTVILTKPLEQDTFARLRGELGVCYPFWSMTFLWLVFVGLVCSYFYFLGLVVALCICIVHVCISHSHLQLHSSIHCYDLLVPASVSW